MRPRNYIATVLDYNAGSVYRYALTLLDGIPVDITEQAEEVLSRFFRESEINWMLQEADGEEAGYIHDLTSRSHVYVYNPTNN